MTKLIGKLSSHRRAKITVELRESNLVAQLFLKALGFVATSTLLAFALALLLSLGLKFWLSSRQVRHVRRPPALSEIPPIAAFRVCPSRAVPEIVGRPVGVSLVFTTGTLAAEVTDSWNP